MPESKPLSCDISGLDDDERAALLDEVSEEVTGDVAVLSEAGQAEIDEIIESGLSADEIASRSGPNFSGPVDPELILIALETTLIVIEGSKLGRVSKDKAQEIFERNGLTVDEEADLDAQ